MCSINPKNWRFTWEAQSQTPSLKLFLFDSYTKPSIHCKNLLVQFNLSQSQLLFVSWTQEDAENVSLMVPVPKVLIDPDFSVSFRALEDHIEVKIVLLLPVDHPILSNLSLNDNGVSDEVFDSVKPLSMDSDLKKLSAMEEVHFYCRSCCTRLTTKPLRDFVEMPSVDWREIADNWFGACCCSFGGVSEKLVNRYADAYACARGLCLLSSATIILCKDDLVGCKFSDGDGTQRLEPRQEFAIHSGSSEEGGLDFGFNARRAVCCDSHSGKVVMGTPLSLHLDLSSNAENHKPKVREEESNAYRFCCAPSISYLYENESTPGCCNSPHYTEDRVSCKTNKATEAMANRRSFLNGFLGNIFMVRSYNLSTNIQWKQFFCPHCSTLLGGYPCADGDAPADDGVRLFKCYLSTCFPVGRTDDSFRKYNLEKMFSFQLIESGKDELSFRTVVRDLTAKSPMLQVVLLNPNSWFCSGNCLGEDCSVESVSKLQLRPAVKLLFSNCSNYKESQLRVLEDWVTKNQADEVFMFPHLIEELTETITSMKDLLPPSCTLFQGLYLSFMLR